VRFLVAQPGPAFAVADVHNGWCEALRELGQDVFEFNLDARLSFYNSVLLPDVDGQPKPALTGEQANELAVNGLYAAILKVRPHVLLSVSSFFTPPELLDIARAAGVKVVLLHTECPYENERQVQIGQHADLNIVDDPTGIEEFPPGTSYFCKAYRPSVHRPGPAEPDLASDLVFVGTAFPSRIRFLEAMDLDGIDVALAGNWTMLAEDSRLREYLAHEIGTCLPNEDTVRLYRSARVGINLYRREAQARHLSRGYSLGPRELEMAACGLFFLREPRPEGDDVLDMLPTFTGAGDASEQLRWWLAHPDQAEAAALKAREAIADRTFVRHARRLLRLLDT